MTWRIICADVMDGLKQLEDESVQVCVTSPPYFGLRSYLPSESPDKEFEIGTEDHPDKYVERMVEVFREVRRVLKPSGLLFLNLGDSFAAQRGGTHMPAQTVAGGIGGKGDESSYRGTGGEKSVHAHRNASAIGLKHKDLIGIPWMCAFALRKDGFYLRSDIIWQKPAPLPESVRDRPTKSYEHVFMMSKEPKYYYNADAIAEPLAASSIARLSQRGLPSQAGSVRVPGKTNGPMKAVGSLGYGKRNARDVWTIQTASYKKAHFAVYPPELARRCILAGSAPGDLVLDPFTGSGTTGSVAIEEGRDFIGLELNPEYVVLAEERIRETQPKPAPEPKAQAVDEMLDILHEATL